MQFDNKEVYFNDYCKICKNDLVEETEDPCDECLTYPTNTESHKPINFEEKQK